MALSQKKLQALRRNRFERLYTGHQALWRDRARNAHAYAAQGLPDGERVRVDDVAAVLLPILETDPTLSQFVQIARLPQKYWAAYFCDYILDQLWDVLTPAAQGGRRRER